MNTMDLEDADVPALAVKGLNEASRHARENGEIIVVHANNLIRIVQNVQVEVIRPVTGRIKVSVRTKRLKK
jgi:hypothetical protein